MFLTKILLFIREVIPLSLCLSRTPYPIALFGRNRLNCLNLILPNRLRSPPRVLLTIIVRLHRSTYAGSGVLLLEVFIGELLPIDRLTASAIAARKVATLKHYYTDNTAKR